MFLKKLEIHGFKSFAKKTALEFEPGIISVVGPNGSGKSNIADSLRWVFGEQSMKLLRGKKSEDVIFAGSDLKSRMGYAEVAVYFDNVDKKFPIDFEEVAISRRLFRDGNSEYIINGSHVRLLDIQELLSKSGFGNTSYHVIGQGTIDQLILGGPGAIKELVEEAAGIKPYYLKREKTLRRLDHSQSNLEQVRALLKEIEPRLRSLRRQTKKLEQREVLENQLKALQSLFFSQNFRSIDAQITEVKTKTDIFDRQAKELEQEMKNMSEDSESQEQGMQKSSEKSKILKSDLYSLQKKSFDIQRELATVQGQIKATEQVGTIQPGIDFEDLKQKFDKAFQGLKKLIQSFTLDEAKRVEGLFAEVAEAINLRGDGEKNEAAQKSFLTGEEKRLGQELKELLDQIQKLELDVAEYAKTEEETRKQLFVKERLLRNKQEMIVKSMEQKNFLSIEQAKLMTRRETLQEETKAALGPDFQKLIEGQKQQTVQGGLAEKIQNLKKQLEMIGGVDDLLVQEYRETEERWQYLSTQSADLEKAIKELKEVIVELDLLIKKDFDQAFAKIAEKFASYFRTLFGGGKATMNILRMQKIKSGLDLTEGEDESEEGEKTEEDLVQEKFGENEIVGIEIRATPPGKKLAGIAALSGGKRTLTSIALLCAMLATFPSPFVVLDEVDAALDEANSIRFGKILGTLAHKTQFITITHNRETMRQSHTLYGITMGEDGISKVLSLKLEQAAVYSTKN